MNNKSQKWYNISYVFQITSAVLMMVAIASLGFSCICNLIWHFNLSATGELSLYFELIALLSGLLSYAMHFLDGVAYRKSVENSNYNQ